MLVGPDASATLDPQDICYRIRPYVEAEMLDRRGFPERYPWIFGVVPSDIRPLARVFLDRAFVSLFGKLNNLRLGNS